MTLDGYESTHRLFQILHQAHNVNQALTKIARLSTGLRFEQVSLLCALNSVGGKATIGTLARHVSRASHTVTALVDTLEARDYLARDRSAVEDRRLVWIRLMPRGAAAASAFQDKLQEVIAARDLERLFPDLLTDMDVTAVALKDALTQDQLQKFVR